MSTKNLNKKSLTRMQNGGQNAQSAEPTLSQQIEMLIQSGLEPKLIAQGLFDQGVDMFDIKDAFMQLGMSPNDIDALFESDEDIQQELDENLNPELTNSEINQEDGLEDYSNDDLGFNPFSGNYLNEAQRGRETKSFPKVRKQTGGATGFPTTMNQYFGITRKPGDDYVRNPMANYLPMDLSTRGNILGALGVAGDAASDLFSGKKDPDTGLKSGFFRDVSAKKARQKEAIPEYYNYNVTVPAGNNNTYVGDIRDLYLGATQGAPLRTDEEYTSDVNKFSQVNYNPSRGAYDVMYSSRQIDPNSGVYGKDQRRDIQTFMDKSIPLGTLRGRFDDPTRQMLLESEKEGMGSLGISPAGEASSYRDMVSNPYLYETMMGINTLQSRQEPVITPTAAQQPMPTTDQIKPLSFQEWVMQDPIRRGSASSQNDYDAYINSLPQQRKGGSLAKAQDGLPEWFNETMRTSSQLYKSPLFGKLPEQQTMDDSGYTINMNQINPDNSVMLSGLQTPAINPFASQLDFNETPSNQQPTNTQSPEVDITNKFAGDLNRFMDSRFMQGYGKLSNLGVAGARVANEFAKERRRAEALDNLYSMTQADKMFGYYEDPLNKQGTWDVNTGLAEQDNRVTYMRQFGGEDGSDMMYYNDMELNEVELDPDTIAQLIAAGADLEIL